MKLKRSIPFFLCVLFSAQALLCRPLHAQSGKDRDFGKNSHGLVGDGEEEGEGKKTRSKLIVFRGYSRHRELFVKVCSAVAADGRADALYGVLNAATQRDPNCVACAPMIKAFASACKGARVTRKTSDVSKAKNAKEDTKAKGSEVVKTKPHKQREPHIEVAENTVRLFSAIADEKDIYQESLKAIIKLLSVLRNPQGLTPAEHDYLSFLASYVESVFITDITALEVANKDKPAGGNSAPAPEVKVDDLFQ